MLITLLAQLLSLSVTIFSFDVSLVYVEQPPSVSQEKIEPPPDSETVQRADLEVTGKNPGPEPEPANERPALPQIREADGGIWDHPIVIEGDDLLARVHFLTAERSWEWRGSTHVRLGDQELGRADSVLSSYLMQPHLQDSMLVARHVIVLGMASCEGSAEQGYLLAADRIESLIDLLRPCRPLRPDGSVARLHSINLGRFREGCGDENPAATQDQRRVVVISLHWSADGGVPWDTLRRHLEDRLQGQTINPANYLEFEVGFHF